MKRMILLAAALLFLVTAGPARAVDVQESQADALDLDGLERAAEEYTGGADLSTGTSLDDGLRQILDTGSEQVSGILRKAVRSGVLLLAIVLLTLLDQLLLPLVDLYVAASVAYTALGNEGLKRVAGALKWVVTTVLTLLLLAFVGYLTVSGVIAGTTDAAAVKAAKFAVSSAVPVVGGILSDAAETVLAGAGILRNTVGVFGMLAVLAMCVVPFLQLGIHYLAYKAAAALTATASQGRVAGLIDSIGGAFGLVLGMTGASALLLLISLVSAISVAAGG